MRICELRVDGFGRLDDRTIVFAPGVNVICGPNEAGKSTLTAAILASLYGFERGGKDEWRPWSGARFATAIAYELADGRRFEVQRDFERDGKGVRVYDAHGNDASGECAVGRGVNPGEAHLGIALEVFVNASFVAQGTVAIDGARAERITHALARALDGGPREDAALGALERLDRALATHVGKKRATVNAPLRRLHETAAEAERTAAEVRERLRALDDLRARLELETARSAALDVAQREHERRGRALRAHWIRSRLDALREVRDDIAALATERERYADVEGFPSYLVTALDDEYRDHLALDALAHARADEATRRNFTPAERAELEERAGDGGALGDDPFDDVQTAGEAATTARDEATVAADRAQAARRTIDGTRDLFGAIVTAAAFVAVAAAVLAIVHEWPYAIATGVLALVLASLGWSRGAHRRRALAEFAAMRRAADDATARERDAATRVAAALEPLNAATIDELRRRRERYAVLVARKAESDRLTLAARTTRDEADAVAATFDDLAARLGAPQPTRAAALGAAKATEARKSARDGIDLRLSMLDVRRSDVLAGDDEFALEHELIELSADGVEAAATGGATYRTFEAERADLERRTSDARAAAAATAAELATSEAQIGDLAALDERVAQLGVEIERLERFERAVTLARTTIDDRTRETHQTFARRLADYASTTFAHLTADRYLDVRVDPTTLAVNVRVPENGAIVPIERLSAGTREQAYLVVRLAMARMLSEGLETAPLLLDDPFAFWDDERIERGYPLLEAAARDGQIVLFTTSDAFAAAARARGAAVTSLAPAGSTLVTSPASS